jgi:hypothetical protein
MNIRSAQSPAVFDLKLGSKIDRLVAQLATRLAVGHERERRSRSRRLSKRLTERLVDNVADGEISLSRAPLGLAQELIVDDQGGPHIDDHTYAQWPVNVGIQ